MGDAPEALARKFGFDSRASALHRARAPERQQQAQQIDRVSSRIASAIVAFFRHVDGQEFHADDLRRFVTNALGESAPDSAGRIMRDLRARGVIAYRVVNRAASLYRAGRVA